MSGNSRHFSPGREQGRRSGRNNNRLRARSYRGSHRNSGSSYNWQRERDYRTFPKFKDTNFEEKNLNAEAMEKSVRSRSSETNSPRHAGGYHEWGTEESLPQRRRRRRRREKTYEENENGKNAVKAESDNWDKREGQENNAQSIDKLSLFSKGHKRFDTSSTDSDVEKLKTQVQILLNTKTSKNPTNGATPVEPVMNNDKQKDASSSSSSSGDDSSSEEEHEVSPKKIKSEKHSEDEVVCLGSIERVENLIEKTSDNGISEPCTLCEKEGHTSFYCFMVCKNCGGKYHNLKDCPKPANISTVLQRLMEFYVSQCRQYNPEQTFDFNSLIQMNNVGMQDNLKRYFESDTKSRSSPAQSSSRRRRSSSTESNCSYSGNKSKKRKIRKTNTDTNNSINQFPFNYGFTPSFPFGTPGIPFGAQGVTINPMLALAQMMGQFPFNSANNRL